MFKPVYANKKTLVFRSTTVRISADSSDHSDTMCHQLKRLPVYIFKYNAHRMYERLQNTHTIKNCPFQVGVPALWLLYPTHV